MSYRTLKRVLGETSLERKCRFLFGGCLLVLITGSFAWYGSSTEELVKEASRESARGLVESIIVMQHWKFWQSDEENKGGQDFSEFVPDLGKGLASRPYRWDFIRPIEDGSSVQDEFESQVAQKLGPCRRRKTSGDRKLPPVVSRAASDRRQPTRIPILHADPDHQCPVRLVPCEPEPGRGRRQRSAQDVGHHHRVSGDGGLLRDRPLRDRQAAQASARRERRGSATATSRCGPTSTPATSSRSWPRPSTACCANWPTIRKSSRTSTTT